jgi:DNA-binding CsgD family transcriptional regulator
VKGDPIAVLDAAYDVEASDEIWLRRVVEALLAQLDPGLGALGYTWDVRAGTVAVRTFASKDCPIPAALWRRVIRSAPRKYVRAWRATPFGTASQIPGWKVRPHREVRALLAGYGCQDLLIVNAPSADRMGCVVAFPLPSPMRIRRGDQACWARVATHIGAAQRLRARIAEAREIAAPKPASSAARNALRAAVAIARTPPRAELRALAHERWSLLDAFEENGKRFVVAVATEAAGLASLSDRERQVLALAATQRTNKLIAYELGLSDSTVRVLLTRACRKLGSRTREDAIERWRDLAAP